MRIGISNMLRWDKKLLTSSPCSLDGGGAEDGHDGKTDAGKGGLASDSDG
jgi:hypothetical protein